MRTVFIIVTALVVILAGYVSPSLAAGVIKPAKQMSPAEERKFIDRYKQWLKKENLDHRPPLVWAVMEDHDWFVEMLLRNGEKIDREEQRGGNALSAAILNKRESIFQHLVKKGANINFTYSREMKGVRPIILAAQSGNTAILKRLIEAGADVNYTVPDKYKTTALYSSLHHHNMEAARILLSVGAKFDPYRLSDGSIPQPVRRNACTLKKEHPGIFAKVSCRQETYKAAPSFPCSKAVTPVEKAICASTEISIYDAELAKLYRAARSSDISGIAGAQRAWILQRDSCAGGRDVAACVLKQYRSRLAQIAKQVIEKGGRYYELLAEKVIDAEVVYLLYGGSYRFGIITSEYFLAAYHDRQFDDVSLLCMRQVSEEGELTGGHEDCTEKRALVQFQSL